MKPLLFASSTWIKGYQPSDIAKKQLQDLLKDQSINSGEMDTLRRELSKLQYAEQNTPPAPLFFVSIQGQVNYELPR